MSPRPPMRARTIRVSDATWDAALEAADQRGEILSEEIRKFLERYAKKKPAWLRAQVGESWKINHARIGGWVNVEVRPGTRDGGTPQFVAEVEGGTVFRCAVTDPLISGAERQAETTSAKKSTK